MDKVILVGGFCEIIELCEDNEVEIIGVIELNREPISHNLRVLGTDDDAYTLSDIIKKYPLIISPDSPQKRKKLFCYYNALGNSFFTLISNRAIISQSAGVKEGTVIQKGVNVSSEVSIGRFVKLNSFSNVMHHSVIGDFTTISPNAVILGKCEIGENCYIGANSSILPHIKICDNVVVGAGAVVTKNIFIPGTYVGTPAKMINSKK